MSQPQPTQTQQPQPTQTQQPQPTQPQQPQHSLHGRVISYRDIRTIPKRNDYISPELLAQTNTTIQNKKPLLFLPTYLFEQSLQDEKYAKAKYKIILVGVVPSGEKFNVIIDEILPYFEVKIPNKFKPGTDRDTFIKDLRERLRRDEITNPVQTSIKKARPFKYYQEHQSEFIRFYYEKEKSRLTALKLIKQLGYETTTDDMGNYYRVVCRDALTTFSSWAYLNDYQEIESDRLKGRTIRVSIKNYKSCDLSAIQEIYNKKDITALDRIPAQLLENTVFDKLPDALLKDKTLSGTWDIETWSKSGDIPQPENPLDCIFALSMTFQWVNQEDAFLKICLCDYPANPHPDYLTIVCGNETNIIKGFAEIFARLKPEFIFGFNDGDYDWNWLIKRASATKGLLIKIAECFDIFKPYQDITDDAVVKYNYKTKHIKIEADTYADCSNLMLNGYIPVDVRVMFRKLYPTAEQSSLKWFLAMNKLGGKADMEYTRLFRIYTELRELYESEFVEFETGDLEFRFAPNAPQELIEKYQSLLEDNKEINYYCMIDAFRCHQLMKIRSVIMDSRQVADIAYVSLYDALYLANGLKVRNLTIAKGQQPPFNIRFTNNHNSETEEGKYPGAYVIPPKKGLKISKLTVEERVKKNTDPRWWNTSQEQIAQYHELIKKYGATQTREQITVIEQNEAITIPKHFKEFWMEPIGRPITGLDFSSLYPSLIRTYNFSPEYCILAETEERARLTCTIPDQRLTRVDFDFNGVRRVAYFVWHNNRLTPKLENGGFDPQFQFGVYPYILNDLFNRRAVLKKQMKKYDHLKEEMEAKGRDYIASHQEEYDDIIFQKNYLNSKQNALKVFMNTFYGEAGNKNSPFFVLEVAGGITSYGQHNLQLGASYVKNKGCGIYYGDSVASYTPILIRRNGKTEYIKIQNLVAETDYLQYNNGKQISYEATGVEIWSDQGWTHIKHVVRHKTDKPMFRVLTTGGIVDVTEDHSLLDAAGDILKPEDAIGSELLTSEHPTLQNPKICLTQDMAWVYGVFFMYGACGIQSANYNPYICVPDELHWLWIVHDAETIQRVKQILDRECPAGWYAMYYHDKWILFPTVNIEQLVKKWQAMFYSNNSKIVPDRIQTARVAYGEAFLFGCTLPIKPNNNMQHIDATQGASLVNMQGHAKTNTMIIISQLSAMSVYALCKRLKYQVVIDSDLVILNRYKLIITNDGEFHASHALQSNRVHHVIPLPTTEDYVYDIETHNHHFSAGIGNLVVHNTDSIYLSMPEKVFDEDDRQYYTGQMPKLDYWTKLVELTFSAIKPINQEVNEMFYQNNGTRFLSMAYEEVLFPVAFTAKKKYFGIPHENIANFKPKDLFIRGLEVKKRGVSEILRKIFMEIMWTCVSPENLFDLLELVQSKIDEIYQRQWDMKDFVQTGVYRPNKLNVKLKTFVTRMKEIGIDIKANERFNYVLVKKYPYRYDLRGRKEELSIGDKIELLETANEQKLEVDLDYYMQGSINGQLARLITYHEMFHVEPVDNSPEELKIAEDLIYKNACKFVEQYCKKYYANYNTFGKTYQKIFRETNKIIGGKITNRDETLGKLLSANVDLDAFYEWFIKTTEAAAVKLAGNYGEEYIKKELTDYIKQMKDVALTESHELSDADIKKAKQLRLNTYQKIYYDSDNSILKQRTVLYKDAMVILQQRLRENTSKFVTLYKIYHNGVDALMKIIKQDLKLDDTLYKAKSADEETTDYTLDDFGVEISTEKLDETAEKYVEQIFDDEQVTDIIQGFKSLYNDFITAQIMYKRVESIVDYLKLQRNHQVRVITQPAADELRVVIKNDLAEILEQAADIDF